MWRWALLKWQPGTLAMVHQMPSPGERNNSNVLGQTRTTGLIGTIGRLSVLVQPRILVLTLRHARIFE